MYKSDISYITDISDISDMSNVSDISELSALDHPMITCHQMSLPTELKNVADVADV